MEVVDLDKAKQLVRDAVARHPNRRNPCDNGGCVYTGPSGKTHCIAGQVFADLGLPVPGVEVESGLAELGCNYEEFAGLQQHFSGDAWEYLCRAQFVFDGGRLASAAGAEPRKWSRALALLEKYEGDIRVY